MFEALIAKERRKTIEELIEAVKACTAETSIPRGSTSHRISYVDAVLLEKRLTEMLDE